jgi:hypothetical protein
MNWKNLFKKKKVLTILIHEVLYFILGSDKDEVSKEEIEKKFKPEDLKKANEILKHYSFLVINTKKQNFSGYTIKNRKDLFEKVQDLSRLIRENNSQKDEHSYKTASIAIGAYAIILTVFQIYITFMIAIPQMQSTSQQNIFSTHAVLEIKYLNITTPQKTNLSYGKICILNRGEMDSGETYLIITSSTNESYKKEVISVGAKSLNCSNIEQFPLPPLINYTSKLTCMAC